MINNKSKILVSIVCITYNHEPYLQQALESFLMQKCNFLFEIILAEDCSTDDTRKICEEYKTTYPDVINYIWSSSNVGALANERRAIQAVRGKYIAICEGDDYWTDPLKLQKQVDFMEAHAEVGVCYTDYNLQYDCDSNIIDSMFEKQHKYRPTTYEEHLLKPGYLAPMTWLIRRELWQNLDKKYADGSYVMMLEWLYDNQVAYLPMVTATYRTHKGSASNPIGEKKLFTYVKGVFDIQTYYTEKYPCSEDLKRKVLMHGYMDVLPVAVMADNDEFVKEAQAYMESECVDISLIIRELKQGEMRKRSKAYRIGKFLLKPFQWLKRG